MSTAALFLFKFDTGRAVRNLVEMFHFGVKNLSVFLYSFSQTRSSIYHDARTPVDIPQGRTAAVRLAAPSQAVSQIQKY
jgi:hypothetical protein